MENIWLNCIVKVLIKHIVIILLKCWLICEDKCFDFMQSKLEGTNQNYYNQVLHLTQVTTCESDKSKQNITYKEPKGQPFSKKVTTRLQSPRKHNEYGI